MEILSARGTSKWCGVCSRDVKVSDLRGFDSRPRLFFQSAGLEQHQMIAVPIGLYELLVPILHNKHGTF